MSYRLILPSLIVVFLDYFVLSPLLPLKESFLVPIFLMALIVTIKDYGLAAATGLICSFFSELLGSFNIGTMTLPFLFSLVLYAWFDRFLNLKSMQYGQDKTIPRFFFETMSVVILMYAYYILSFFLQKLIYGIDYNWQSWLVSFFSYKTLVFVIPQSILILIVLWYLKDRNNPIMFSRYD